MKKYYKKTEAMNFNGWKNLDLAFPDKNCECLKEDYIRVKCEVCGADRTENNWYTILKS